MSLPGHDAYDKIRIEKVNCYIVPVRSPRHSCVNRDRKIEKKTVRHHTNLVLNKLTRG